ncbi:hypothetical protein RhiirB3_475383 [Rhizophagus irregularis]|nr:hypothetical protein RhiirB3_475383 [Rhizophagus irregularis]
MDGNKLLRKLSQNLLEVLDDGEYYDIIIKVGDVEPYVKIFRAHMAILNYRSPYLREILFENKMKNYDGTLVRIELPNILPEIFQVILRSNKRRVRRNRQRLKKIFSQIKIINERKKPINYSSWDRVVLVRDTWNTEEHLKNTWEKPTKAAWDYTLEGSAGGWGETPVVPQSAGGWNEDPVAPQYTDGWDDAPVVPQSAGGWNEEPVAPQSAGGWDETSVAPQSAGGWNEEPVAPQSAGGWNEEPVAPQSTGGWDAPVAPQSAGGWNEEPVAPQSAGGWDEEPVAPQSAGGWD